MAKKVVQLYDKYHSTTKVFPKVIEECLPEDIVEKINDKEILTLEIEESQFTDETHFTLTDSQLAQLKGQAVIKVILNDYILVGVQRDYVDALYYSYTFIDVTGGTGAETLLVRKIDIVKETGAGEIIPVSAGGGKQLYQHNITFKGYLLDYTDQKINISLTIINDNNTPINSYTLLATFLTNKGCGSQTSAYACSGSFYSTGFQVPYGIMVNNGVLKLCYGRANDGTDQTSGNINWGTGNSTITDTIITL